MWSPFLRQPPFVVTHPSLWFNLQPTIYSNFREYPKIHSNYGVRTMVLVNVIISSRQLNQSVFFSTIGRIGLDCSNCWGIWNPSIYPAFDFWLQRGPVCWFWVDNVYSSRIHLFLCYQSFYPPIFRRGSKILRAHFRGGVIKSSFWKGGLPLGGSTTRKLTFVLRWEK